jgi:hypothetical protein
MKFLVLDGSYFFNRLIFTILIVHDRIDFFKKYKEWHIL